MKRRLTTWQKEKLVRRFLSDGLTPQEACLALDEYENMVRNYGRRPCPEDYAPTDQPQADSREFQA